MKGRPKKPRKCKCLEKVDKALAPRNARLARAVSILRGKSYPVFVLEKVDPKEKGERPTLVPSFCPFCGAQYERADRDLPTPKKTRSRPKARPQ